MEINPSGRAKLERRAMGIHGLTKLLADSAPSSQKEVAYDSLFGRKVAVDASMHLYQFLAVVGRQGDQTLTSESGETTAHLQGMFMRTARMLETGIKPAYVFDGKPPTLKGNELAKRSSKKADAEEKAEEARDANDREELERQAKRQLTVTSQHTQEVKRLLRAMGVPVLDSPCEAEASCAELVKRQYAWAVASEDMDTLCFGAPILLRNMMAPQSQNKPVLQVEIDKALSELEISQQQFVDICLLCGSDYLPRIPNIGPKSALNLVKKHGSMESVLSSLDKNKYSIPDEYPHAEARELFMNAEVLELSALEEGQLAWSEPNEEEIVNFLVHEKTFNEDRVRKTVQRIKKAKSKGQQGRLENFFGQASTVRSTTNANSDSKKRNSPQQQQQKGGSKKQRRR